MVPGVLKEHGAFIFMGQEYLLILEDEVTMSVQNVWNHLPIDTVSYTRRHDSSETML
jgi:hypothetical protein